MSKVIVYTDGSCNAKTRLGGIGVYMYLEDNEESFKTVSVGFKETKTGRMEILAMITALSCIKKELRSTTKMVINSDSQYVVNSVNKRWVWRWQMDYGGLDERTNGDLWKLFLEVWDTWKDGNVVLKWVKGHSGVVGNEIADMLAGSAYKGGDYRVDTKTKMTQSGELEYE